jgi:PAS domain S-box-containing protein
VHDDDLDLIKKNLFIDKCKLFNLLIRNMPIGLFALDKNREIIEFNSAAEKITGYKKEEVLGRQCSEILNSNICNIACPLQDPSHPGPIDQEAIIKTKDQQEIPVIFSTTFLKDEQGQIYSTIRAFRDISEIRRLEGHRKILISMFAHDLKAPIAIAGGFVIRLLKGKAGPLTPKQYEYLTIIDEKIRQLDSYIRSFLDILKMQSGQIPLSLEPCSMSKLIYEIIEGFRIKASERNIYLNTELSDSLPLVLGDREQLQRVISNLLDNAIKYSSEGAEVIIRANETSEYVVCQVQNSGPGIKSKDLPHIFDPFFNTNLPLEISSPLCLQFSP